MTKAVWVNESACKGCKICVSYCPAGVIAMRDEPTSIVGAIVEVVDESSCIGCRECEFHCPDFAIFVADESYKFAKLTKESKQRAIKIKENNFFKVESDSI
ncbi:MAG: 4Fe-4S binding protein [Campylobacteraceae bacterium]|nr:4Fe-4S binding protein [Campylobacteraceae bacterium]